MIIRTIEDVKALTREQLFREDLWQQDSTDFDSGVSRALDEQIDLLAPEVSFAIAQARVDYNAGIEASENGGFAMIKGWTSPTLIVRAWMRMCTVETLKDLPWAKYVRKGLAPRVIEVFGLQDVFPQKEKKE